MGDPSIFIWDALSGAKQRTLEGHSDAVNGLHFRPMPIACHILASASQDTSIRVWDVESGRSLLQVPVLDPVSSLAVPVTSITFTSSLDTMISSSDDKTIRMWHSVSGSQLWCYSHWTQINPNAMLVKGERFVFGDDISDLYITSAGTEVDIMPPTKIFSCTGRKVQALFPSWVDDGLTVSIEDHGLQMFDIEKRKIYETTLFPTAAINHVAYRYPGLTAISSMLSSL